MSDHKFLVWIEIEEVDGEGDHVDGQSESPLFSESACFESPEAASDFASTLHKFAGLLALPEAVKRLKPFRGPGGTDAEDNVKARLQQIGEL